MRKLIIFLIALSLLIGTLLPQLSSCGRRSEDVSVLYYSYSDTYISSVRGQLDSMLKSSGISYNNYDANGNQATQTEQVDTAITKGTKLLCVNIVNTGSEDAARAIVDKARAADIPVIFFNRSVSEEIVSSYEKCVFVGTDYNMAGRMQGEMIGNYIAENFAKTDINGDGKISYVMFKGQQGNAEAEARTKYAVEEADKIITEKGFSKLSFYDKQNKNGYLLDQDGTWSNAAANNHMKTLLSGYSEAQGNMVELVIANNDEMALGALAALEEAGYNKAGSRYIPVFGVDATEGAIAKINNGAMSGTVKQDAEGMAKAIEKICENYLGGSALLEGVDAELKVGEQRINIPYSLYTKEGTEVN